MGTTSDRDEHPEDDDAESDAGTGDEKEAEAGGKAPEAAGEDEAADAPADEPAKDAPAAAKAAKTGGAKARPGGAKRAGAKPAARPRHIPPPSTAQGGSLGKSMILFLVIIGGLAGAFAYFGRETGGSGASPRWKPGDKPEVEVTLVPNDRQELACWSPEELAGRHCAFEGPDKPWSKGGDGDDKKLLKPYTTTDRTQFLAAGLWSDPALSGKLPAARFAVKCTYQVEGRIKRPGVRWSSEGAWSERTEDWYAGLLTNCRLINP